MIKLHKIHIFILLTFHSLYSYASETGYEVEVIIFEDTASQYLDSEDWSYNDMLNNRISDSSELVTEPDPEFKELEWEGAVINDSLDKIKSNQNYNILVNKRWKQTGLDRDKAYSIYVSSYEPKSNITSSTTAETALETSATPDSYINGQIKLIMSRYLHFEVNLNYYRRLSSDMSESEQYTTYPVVAERRMRSREIHYIDHPMIGIIVYTTPYKIEDKVETDSVKATH